MSSSPASLALCLGPTATTAPTTTLPPSLSSPKCRTTRLFTAKPYHSNPNPNLQVTWCSPSSSDYNLEEQRWLREEQRWLREEQRWLREERRWNREREILLEEISRLKVELREVDLKARSVGEGGVVGLLEEEKLVIEESGVSVSPLVLEGEKVVEEREVMPTVVEEKKQVEEHVKVESGTKKEGRKMLRMGAEGDEVKELQEALLKLGYYSGEEDMDYSSFSTGTDRAVKTWQASIGAKEDGIMTAELLERLYFGQTESSGSAIKSVQKDGANGAAITSLTEVSGIQQTVVKESNTGVEVSQQRVFLLGENRWEEPTRLANRNKQVDKSKSDGNKNTQCFACRGVGRMMCTECDGTGEPNIEPQFMEWLDEGTKCPYCGGLGYTICDVCDGKAVT